MTLTHQVLAQTTWSDIGIPLLVLALAGITVIVLLWQIFATSRARASGAQEEAYRSLAEQATEAQQRTATALEALAADLQDVRRRTDELERILKSVE